FPRTPLITESDDHDLHLTRCRLPPHDTAAAGSSGGGPLRFYPSSGLASRGGTWPRSTDKRPIATDSPQFAVARVGRIDRSRMGSINLGVVGSKPAVLKPSEAACWCKSHRRAAPSACPAIYAELGISSIMPPSGLCRWRPW